MTDTPRRVFTVLCGLIVVWIAAYWLWEPAEPPVTFGQRPAIAVPLTDMAVDPLAQTHPEPPPATKQTAAAALSSPPPAPPPLVRRVIPPSFRDYQLQAGDSSFEIIAQRQLGDRRLAEAIARANPLLTPDKLIPGRTVVKIPLDPGNIQGRPVQEPPAPAPASTDTIEYTVVSGDTLSGIARQFYADPNRWQPIFEANQDQLPTPTHLRPGMVLKIPPSPQ